MVYMSMFNCLLMLATVAQSDVHLIGNQKVAGSIPTR